MSFFIASAVSIPKDKKGDICDSDNYRGIALASSLTKIPDEIILNCYGSFLKTSEMQFAFQPKHSTGMCVSTFKEVVQYYNNHNSKVYCCMVDASKAFDRLWFDKLFDILRTRGLL